VDSFLLAEMWVLHCIGYCLYLVGDVDEEKRKHNEIVHKMKENLKEKSNDFLLYGLSLYNIGISQYRSFENRQAYRSLVDALQAQSTATDFESKKEKRDLVNQTMKAIEVFAVDYYPASPNSPTLYQF